MIHSNFNAEIHGAHLIAGDQSDYHNVNCSRAVKIAKRALLCSRQLCAMSTQHGCVGSTLLSLMVSVTAISAQGLVCYYCLHSNDNQAIEQDQNQNPECLNKRKFSALPEMRRICALNETSCSVSKHSFH